MNTLMVGTWMQVKMDVLALRCYRGLDLGASLNEYNRVGASIAHDVCHCRRQTPA